MFGSNRPVILEEFQHRDEEPIQYHEIDGAVYIAGTMDGEALDWGLESKTYFFLSVAYIVVRRGILCVSFRDNWLVSCHVRQIASSMYIFERV